MIEHEAGAGIDRWDALAGSYGSSPVVARLAKGLVDLVAISSGESVIDLGTGTGLALVRAAKVGGAAALGVDRSFSMLEAARVRMTEAALANTALVRADAAQVPVGDASFDVALAASVWQFLGYSPMALAEWRRVLNRDGRLELSVPGPGSGASIPDDLMAKYFSRLRRSAQADFVSRASPHPMPDLAEATAAAGFSEATVVSRTWEDVLPGPEDWWAIQWTHAVRFFLQALDPEALETLKAEAIDRLVRSDTGEVIVTTKVLYCAARC